MRREILSVELAMVVIKDVLLPTYDDLAVEEIKLSSPALKAAATHVGKYCDEVNKVSYLFASSCLTFTT